MAGTSGQPKKVVIDFSIMSDEAVRNIQSLNKELDALKVRQLQLKAAKQQDSEEYIKNQAAIKAYTAALKANEKELDNNIKAQQEDATSLNAMRAQLRSLISAYSDLGKAERESALGDDYIKQIDELSTAIEKQEEAMHIHSRTVGDYNKIWDNMPGPIGKIKKGFDELSGGTGKVSVAFKNGGKAVAAFGKQLLKLLANPIVAAIAAIAAVVMKLVSAFQKNDDAMTKLKLAFANFQPIITAIDKAFNFLVDKVVKVIEGFGKLFSWITKLNPKWKESADKEKELIQSQEDLEDAENDYIENSSARREKLSELAAKVADKEKYTAEERKDMLNQMAELEKQELQEKKDIAEEKLRLYEAEVYKTGKTFEQLTDEEKKQIKLLRAAIHDAAADFNEGMVSINKKTSSAIREIDSERNEKAKEFAKQQEDLLKKQLEERRKTEDLALQMLTDSYAKQREALRLQYVREIEDLKARIKKEKKLQTELTNQIKLLRAEMLLELAKLDEQYSEQNLSKLLEIQRKITAEQIKGMKDGYNKSRAQMLENQRNEIEDLNNETQQMEKRKSELEASISKLRSEQDSEGVSDARKIQIEKEIENLEKEVGTTQELIYANVELRDAVIERQNAETQQFEANQQKKLSELQNLNALQEQLNAINGNDLLSFQEKELAKTRIMQQEAQNRYNIAKEEFEQISEQLKNADESEMADLQVKFEEAKNKMLLAENELQNAIKSTTQALLQQNLATIDNFNKIASSIGNMVNGMNDLFTTMAENNEEYNKFATAMALAQIYINMAISIATALSAAMESAAATGPGAAIAAPIFVAELIGIVASTIASTIATLNKAKSTKPSTPKFATGGYIDHGQNGVDKVPIMATRGEYVIRKDKVDELGVSFFDKINFGKALRMPNLSGHYATGGMVNNYNMNPEAMEQMMKRAFVEAVSEMPNPIVDVRQITDQQRRVQIKQNIAKV